MENDATLRGIDANVLLRYLLDDVPEQSERARRLIDSDHLLGLTAVTLAEVAWTLAGPYYHYDRVRVAHELIQLLGRNNLICVAFDKAVAQLTLSACVRAVGAADLGDAIVAACLKSAGMNEVYTFDLQFGRTGLATRLP